MGSTDLHQLNSQFSKEGRKDLFPKVLRTNHPAPLTARTHSLAVHLGPALGGSRFSISSHTGKLSSYLLYHSSLYFILAETNRTSLAGSQRGLSLPSRKDGDWDETAPFTGRAKMGKSVCVCVCLRRTDRDGRDHPGDKENTA